MGVDLAGFGVGWKWVGDFRGQVGVLQSELGVAVVDEWDGDKAHERPVAALILSTRKRLITERGRRFGDALG